MDAIRDLEFEPGDRVRVTDGPFRDFVGDIDEIDRERGKVRVKISFFGRPTPIELDLSQINRI